MEIIGAIIIIVAILFALGWFMNGEGPIADILNVVWWAIRKLWPILACLLIAGIIFSGL
jgi:hypothetical protein